MSRLSDSEQLRAEHEALSAREADHHEVDQCRCELALRWRKATDEAEQAAEYRAALRALSAQVSALASRFSTDVENVLSDLTEESFTH